MKLFLTLESLSLTINGIKIRLSNIRQNCNSFKESLYHCVSEVKELHGSIAD